MMARQSKHPGDDVLAALVKEGLTNREIAGRLGLAENSIKRYLSAAGIARKMGRPSHSKLRQAADEQSAEQAPTGWRADPRRLAQVRRAIRWLRTDGVITFTDTREKVG
jgi:DNA-binding NarL/FixJ family response regulator